MPDTRSVLPAGRRKPVRRRRGSGNAVPLVAGVALPPGDQSGDTETTSASAVGRHSRCQLDPFGNLPIAIGTIARRMTQLEVGSRGVGGVEPQPHWKSPAEIGRAGQTSWFPKERLQ